MPNYRFTALDGNGRDVEGVVSGASEDEVIATLKEAGVFPTSIEETDATADYSPSFGEFRMADIVPSGSAVEGDGLPCEYKEGRAWTKGFLNVEAGDSQVFLVFNKPTTKDYLRVDFSEVVKVEEEGFFRKELAVHMAGGVNRYFRGPTQDLKDCCRLGLYVSRQSF